VFVNLTSGRYLQKSTLKQIFTSTFHNRYNLDEFLNINVSKNIKKIEFDGISFFKTKPELKDYQIFLNHTLISYMKVNENVVFSYRKGTSVYEALFPHRNNRYFLKTDIKSFFGSIDKSLVEQCLLSNINEYPISKDEIETYSKQLLNLITYENKLPVGFTTSSKLSNAVLYEFDNKLEEYCIHNDISYTRYSDDLIFSTNSIDVLDNVINKVESLFNKYYNHLFSLNNKKTKFYKAWERIKILGLVITPNGNITIDKKYKKDVEVIFHYYLTDRVKFNSFFHSRFDSKMSKISGLLNHINGVDKNYILKLRKRYGNYIVDIFLHRDKNE
jgi:RNA-directed DNA polymerase